MANLYSKSEAETLIRRRMHTNVQDETVKKAIDEVINGVAELIEANNKAIESKVTSLMNEKLRDFTR